MMQQSYLRIYRTNLRQIFGVGRTMSVSVNGRCRGSQFLSVLSTKLMDVAGCMQLMVQLGRLTSGFDLHLV